MASAQGARPANAPSASPQREKSGLEPEDAGAQQPGHLGGGSLIASLDFRQNQHAQKLFRLLRYPRRVIRPVQISAGPPTAPRPASRSSADDRFTPGESSTQEELLAALARARTPYYDAAKDLKAQAEYYSNIDPQADLYGQLHELVVNTHTVWLDYDAAKSLYPWVDLRPSLRLQSVYSPLDVATNDPLHKPTDSPKLFKKSRNGKARLQARLEKRAEQYEQGERWLKALATAPHNAAELAAQIALLEANNYYNCEHAVPQVLFDRADPMRGDLHQLFTAERDINAVRSNLPLRDFPEYDGTGAEPEGYATDQGFEPAGGHGKMARAVLYFMVRYPWVLQKAGELGYNREHLETLLRWHEEDPPDLYEQHRNAAIAREQGNRNPFIDHPEWARKVDFSPALADA